MAWRLLQESGSALDLEDDSGVLILEEAPPYFEIVAVTLGPNGSLPLASLDLTGDVPPVRRAPVSVSVPRFRVALFEPLPSLQPTDVFDEINPNRTSLGWSTGIPGGFRTAEIGMVHDGLPERGRLPRRGIVRPRGRGVIYEGGAVVFEGLVSQGRGKDGSDGFTLSGYGVAALTDGYFASADATASTAGAVFRAVLAAAAPYIRVGGDQEWRDSGTEHTLAEMNYRTPAGVQQQLSIEGGISNIGYQTWNWAVYADRIASFWPNDAPSVARYLIPYDDDVDWTEYYDDMYSSADLLYGPSGSLTLEAGTSTEGFLARWGFSRTALLTAGEMTATSAAIYLATWLASHAEPQRTVTVRRRLARGLEMRSGAERPCWLVRAGEPDGWVEIGEPGDPSNPVLPIVGTSFDANSMEASYELGIPNPEEIGQNLQDLCMETSLLARGVDPLTGTRLRS